MAGITKNFGKLKQWTSERLGHAGRTDVSEDFKVHERACDMRAQATERVFVVGAKYAKTLDAKKIITAGINEAMVPTAALGDTMGKLAVLLPQDSAYGHALDLAAKTEAKLGAAQYTMLSALRSGFLADLDAYLVECKRFSDQKRKLESRRLDFDAKLARVQKAKREKPELEEEVRAAQQKYEETVNDMQQRMAYLLDFEQQGTDLVHALVEAQLQFHRECTQHLAELQQQLAQQGANAAAAAPRPQPPRAPLSRAGSMHSMAESLPPQDPGYSVRSGISREPSSDSLAARRPPPPPPTRTTNTYNTNNNTTGPFNPSTQGVHVMPMPSPTAVPLPAPSTTPYAAPVSSTTPYQPPSTAAPPPPLPHPAAAPARQVVATFDFKGENPTELDLRKGDVVTVVEEIDAGWWIGELAGRRGMFPSNYTAPYTPPPPPAAVATPPPPQPPRSGSYPSLPRSASQQSLPPVVPRSGSQVSLPKSVSAASLESAGGRSYLGGSVPPAAVAAPATAAGPCATCGCTEFVENVFKRGSCNNCFHKH